MSTGAMLAAIIGAAMALTLAWRSLRSHDLGRSKMLQTALIWAAIIAALTLIISQVKA